MAWTSNKAKKIVTGDHMAWLHSPAACAEEFTPGQRAGRAGSCSVPHPESTSWLVDSGWAETDPSLLKHALSPAVGRSPGVGVVPSVGVGEVPWSGCGPLEWAWSPGEGKSPGVGVVLSPGVGEVPWNGRGPLGGRGLPEWAWSPGEGLSPGVGSSRGGGRPGCLWG